MKIEILGSGCARCKALTERVEQTIKRAGINAEIVKVADIADIARRGILSTPGLAIDGRLVSTGRIPTLQQVIGWLAPAPG